MFMPGMMLPFEAPTIFEGIHKSYFRMPRVVKDQRSKFENDDLFRQLSHESAVKYTGFKDRPVEERQMKFITNCQEGHTEVSVVQSGNQFTLMFNPAANPAYSNEGCDFDKELGKVHIKAGFILNGVCVLWRGWLDLQRLEGFGCLEFDEYRAYLEDALIKQQLDKQQQQQQQCNTLPNANATSTTNSQAIVPPPLGRLSHPALAAHPNALNPIACQAPLGLGQAPPPVPPPVTLADSYGNAAIAAAAAAAFHQALGVPPPPQAMLGPGPGPGQPPLLAPPPPGSQQHLPYANGNPLLPSTRVSLGHQQHLQRPHSNGGSPDHQSQHQHQQQQQHRQATKRSLEEQTQVDEVDVVSDIRAHDLDFPPRRIFKSDAMAHQQITHRATRRA